ncbi:S41 family peptidase [Fulvivirga sedimenti]|uniref:Tricorn protease homolog n=1 Tax=Fulvivirga sedimenti TaxID=2879465 RepID=A0A9X1HK52_9BACT|nr:S41 family peptidase [Fulvivirga sedimenti]MCA6073281.1 PDZ domain-containing protein [Fulvivirga sedimenti]
MKKTLVSLAVMLIAFYCSAQIDARLMRYPDVSATHITFVYGDDIWLVEKSGGTAVKLSSPPGEEMFPRFSPDGQMIAFTANYEGNNDVYVVSVRGGIPKRLTYHGMTDRVLGWHPDGDHILFASSRESGRQRYNQFYTISKNGGSPEKLDVPYGEYASFSPDGKQLAYTDRSRVQRTWKRYRGGTAPDIHVFNLDDHSTSNITTNDANDELPMWHGDDIYFLSDQGPEQRANIWKYSLTSGTASQMTNFTDFDLHFPGIGPDDIIFQAGDQLYLLSIATGNYSTVQVNVITDQMGLMPVQKNVSSMMQSATISPDGKRVIVQARGELFSLPASEGYVQNLTQTSGAAERNPSWSPDGRYVACWSDAQGEYQLTLYDMEGSSQPKTVSAFNDGFRYAIYWSPDSKHVAYVNQAMEIQVMDVTSGLARTIDKGFYMFEGPLQGFSVSWSPDSQWITYARDYTRVASAIFIYNVKSGVTTQVTSGYYNDQSPVFSADGKYLFFATSRNFQPSYSDLDNTFIYANSTQLAVIPLDAGTPSILAAKNDAVEIKKEEVESPEKKGKNSKSKDEEPPKESEEVKISFVGFEERAELLDIPAGNYGNLAAAKDKLVFSHYPNTGAADGSSALKFYDIKDRKVKTVMDGVGNFQLSANGEQLLIMKNGTLAVIPLSEGAKMDKTVPTKEMMMTINPREEWRQIFNDAWRLERDYFYDPNMHGVDWNAMKTRYGALIEQANSRTDVNFILGELIGELNASHTYKGGGDLEDTRQMNVGYLGADFSVDKNLYRIDKIIKGAPWDVEVMSPLHKPGVDVAEGDYIMAVNGQRVTADKPVFAWFQGLANSTVELAVSKSGSMTDARKVLVEPMSGETRLRHLAWIESNRKRVEEATDGRIGYVYVRSTGIDGQNELIRQYYGQIDKAGMIIDERFNSGGQIPDRFIELLNRKPLAFWAVRDGKDWAWPPVANFGPKVMLINGFSGSGGDAFPDYFRKAGLGPLIGTRTWGGLIGISGVPSLIDNGSVTVPTFRMYDPDGAWFKEGHGVDPDIEVVEDFQKLADGTDAQLEAAITEVLKQLNGNSAFKKPNRPSAESR